MDPKSRSVLHRHDHDHTQYPGNVSPHPHHPRLPGIRDLRFEYGYLRSIQQYVDFQPETQAADGEGLRLDGSEKIDQAGLQLETSTKSEVIHIPWGGVAWVTVRDQIISPLLQGAFW